jgi:hypothetical protein
MSMWAIGIRLGGRGGIVRRDPAGAKPRRGIASDSPRARREASPAARQLLQSAPVTDHTLRLLHGDDAPIALGEGMLGIAPATDGPGLRTLPAANAPVRLCMDRRGAWLVVDGPVSVHVNGRPVQRMALLRQGDMLHLDGRDLLLAGDPPLLPDRAALALAAMEPAQPPMLVRGLGGTHHGRSVAVNRPLLVGRSLGADIRLADDTLPERIVRLEPRGREILLRDLGGGIGVQVNGHAVRDALLVNGDQVLIAGRHRFLIESAGEADAPLPIPETDVTPAPEPRPSAWRRLPWLLLAALALALVLFAVLGFGG